MKQLLLKKTELTASSVEMAGVDKTGIIIKATAANRLVGRTLAGVVFFDVMLDLEVYQGGDNFKIIPTIHPNLAKRGAMLIGAYSFDGGKHLRMHFYKPENKITLSDGDEMIILNFVEPITFLAVDPPDGNVKLFGKSARLDDQKTQQKSEAQIEESAPSRKKRSRARKKTRKEE